MGFPGQERFKGPIVHPQKWKEDHNQMIKGKKVAMIGSGATAVTILPSIADNVEHVTVIQRTPSYIGAKPEIDPLVRLFNDWLPQGLAASLARWKAVVLGALFYHYCVYFPNHARRQIKK